MIRMRVRRQLPRLKLRALAANRACIGLRAAQLHELAEAFDLGGVPAGTVLVMQGRGDDLVYLVVRGVVEVSESGRLVTFLRDGDFFGLMVPPAATVTAATALTLLVGPRDRFQAVAGAGRGTLERVWGGSGQRPAPIAVPVRQAAFG